MDKKKLRLPVAKDGIKFILFLVAHTCLFIYLEFECLTVIAGALAIFVIYFFRDPERNIPDDAGAITSPADGKIVDIKQIEKQEGREEGVLVSIFLSIFNVHINRMPYSGKIITSTYNAGKFLPAFRDKASELNEQNKIVIEDDKGIRIEVKQIAGLIARRIVCWVTPGDKKNRGERFGLIRFGSRVDILMPSGTKLNIKIGDKVKGGETILGRLKS